MGVLSWLREKVGVGGRAAGVGGGSPQSPNGASSFHLIWDVPTNAPVVEVSARLTVLGEPAVKRLYFWALQVTFDDGGGAHVGLQWLPSGGGGGRVVRSANWGGYEADGRELAGSPGGNTQPFEWEVGLPYTLRVRRVETGWEGSVVGGTGGGAWSRVVVAGGDSLRGPMVWSEVFARCDDPPVRVRWDQLRVVTLDGSEMKPTAVRVSYQSAADGGCPNTDVEVDGDGLVQACGVPRTVEAGASLPVV
jgi:hypothetical protein